MKITRKHFYGIIIAYFLLVAIMISIKWYDDFYIARVGTLSTILGIIIVMFIEIQKIHN
jgi:general stress protein CsbA